jgi:PIN domain nuclease of toxin-antitoxin system
VHDVVERVTELGVTLLRIELSHILLSSSLPHHHSDPFDRMLIAQAMEENLPVLTCDPQFAAYGIETIWQ